jgi:plastocyanin
LPTQLLEGSTVAFSPSARLALLATTAGATLALAACGTGATAGSSAEAGAAAPGSTSTMAPMPSGPAVTPAEAPVAGDHVAIRSFAFGPAAITVKPGTTVTWTQQDEDQHTVTADDGSFASSPLTTGQGYTHTFTDPGTYHYHCSIHPFMHGTVVVANG